MRLWPKRRNKTNPNLQVKAGRLTPTGDDGLVPTASQFFGGVASLVGYGPVYRAEALLVPPLVRGHSLILGTISAFDLVERVDGRRVPNPFLGILDPTRPASMTISDTLDDLLFYGRSWWRVLARRADGYPSEAEHVCIGRVSYDIDQDGLPIPPIRIDGKDQADRDVIRFDSPLIEGILVKGAVAIKTALSLEIRSGRAADEMPMGAIKNKGPALPKAKVVELLDNWAAAREEREVGYLDQNLDFETYVQSARDLQLVEGRQQSATEIANLLNLSPWYVGAPSGDSMTYSNVTQARRDLIDLDLRPWLTAIEGRLSMGDVTPRGHRVRFDADDFLRGAPADRMAWYGEALELGILTLEEVRTMEDLAPAPRPSQDLAAATSPNHPTYFRPVRRVTSSMPDAPRMVTFAHPVRCDVGRREISGRLVPYGQVGNTSVGPLVFAPGAFATQLQAADDVEGGMPLTSTPLLLQHDEQRPLGRMTSFESTADGLEGTWRVSRTQAGDEALTLAQDGVRAGLSVGAWIVESEFRDDGTEYVTRAELTESSLVLRPAFSSARVSSVAASQGGNGMPCRHGRAVTECDECRTTAPVTASNDQPAAAPEPAPVTSANAAGSGVTQRDITASDPGPAIIPATPRAHVVREPEPYNPATAAAGVSWVRDIIAAQYSGDRDASERLRRLNAALDDRERQVSAAITPPPAGIGSDWRWPSYLADRYVQPRIAAPVLLQLMAQVPLDAARLVIPILTSDGTGPALQATELADLVQFTPVTTDHSVAASTYGCEVLISQQSVDWTSPALDAVVSNRMGRKFRANIDAVLTTTVLTESLVPKLTAATWDYAGIREQVEKAKTSIALGTDGMPAEAIVMSSNAWEILALADDTTGRPLIPYAAPMNVSAAMGAGEDRREGLVGTLCGLPVYVDTSLDANTTPLGRQIIVGAFSAGYVGITGPRVRTLYERDSRKLQVVVQGYGYVAGTVAHDAKAYAVITGPVAALEAEADAKTASK